MTVALRLPESRPTSRVRPGTAIAGVQVFEDMRRAEPLWRALERRNALATPYQRFDFLAPWQREVGRRKGVVPVLLARRLGVPLSGVAVVGLAAFVGHLYSCFLGFDGGKGVATGFGVLLALAPLGATIAAVVFVVALALARYVSVASLVAAGTTTPLLLALGYPLAVVAVGLVTSVLIAARHRDNIRRLRFGTEPRIGVARQSSADSGVA